MWQIVGCTLSGADPPAETGHPGQDVQCRCVGTAVVTQAARDRIQASQPHSVTSLTGEVGGPPIAPSGSPAAPKRVKTVKPNQTKEKGCHKDAAAGRRPTPGSLQEGMFEQAGAPPSQERLDRFEKLQADGNKVHAKLLKGRPGQQYGTRQYYGKETYGGMNEKLRGLDTPDARALSPQKIKSTLDDLYKDAKPLERNLTLYRGEYGVRPPASGVVFDRAPWSTSTSPGTAIKFARGDIPTRQTVYQIQRPRGQRP